MAMEEVTSTLIWVTPDATAPGTPSAIRRLTRGVTRGARRVNFSFARRAASTNRTTCITPDAVTPMASQSASVSRSAKSNSSTPISTRLNSMGAPAAVANRPWELSPPPISAVTAMHSV